MLRGGGRFEDPKQPICQRRTRGGGHQEHGARQDRSELAGQLSGERSAELDTDRHVGKAGAVKRMVIGKPSAAPLRAMANRCRAAADTAPDQDTFQKFVELAADLDAEALKMERKPGDSNGGT